MNSKKYNPGLVLIFLMCWSGLLAQQSPVTSGGKSTGSDGTVNYTVGQVFSKDLTGTGGTITPGMQQDMSISVVTGMEVSEVSLKLSVFPNPTSDVLILNIEDHKPGIYSYLLLDMNGKILERKALEQPATEIGLKSLAPSVYFLKVLKSREELKSFRIIKN